MQQKKRKLPIYFCKAACFFTRKFTGISCFHFCEIIEKICVFLLSTAEKPKKVVLYHEVRKKGGCPMSSEEAIIQLLFERNEAGLCFFEQKYKNLCLKLAFDITGSEQVAEECLNDLYLRLWNTIPPERPKSLKSYACLFR